MTVTKNHRAGADQIIDEFAAILVNDTRSMALADEDIRIEIAKATRRQYGAGAGGKIVHMGAGGHHGLLIVIVPG